LVDVENAIIVDVEATTAIRQAEVLAAKRMIQRSLERFDLYPTRLLGDSAYGSAEMLGWLLYEQGIEPHVTVFDKSARTDRTFSREDFTYDHTGDVYRCPGGKILTTTGTAVNDDATILYRASKHDCARPDGSQDSGRPYPHAEHAAVLAERRDVRRLEARDRTAGQQPHPRGRRQSAGPKKAVRTLMTRIGEALCLVCRNGAVRPRSRLRGCGGCCRRWGTVLRRLQFEVRSRFGLLLGHDLWPHIRR
jgi:hypothetical protein